MGSNVSENKPSELFPHAAAIGVNLGSAISHDITAEAAVFFSGAIPRTTAAGSGAFVSLSEVLRSGRHVRLEVTAVSTLVENPAVDISLPAMCHHISTAQLHQISRTTNKRPFLHLLELTEE